MEEFFVLMDCLDSFVYETLLSSIVLHFVTIST